MGTKYHETDLPESYPLRAKDNTYGIPDGNNYNGNPGNEIINVPTDRRQQGWKTNWRVVLFDFSQRTTLHGVNKITEDNPFTIRR